MPRPEDEFTDEPPRRRRRPDDDDDDVPRRRSEDEDDEDDRPRRRRPRRLTGLDGMFANTSMVALVLFGFCCGWIALILGIVGLCVCKDEIAKRNALIVTIISAAMAVIGAFAAVAQVALRR